eukprot:351208-Chlamydomonas_euryale.AAC.8
MAGITFTDLKEALDGLREELREELHSDLAFLAFPQARSIVNQLGRIREVVYGKDGVQYSGFRQAASPLQLLLQQPGHRSKLAQFTQQYPGLGNTPEQLAANFQNLRMVRNREQHLDNPEDVLRELQQLRMCSFMPALERRDPFLHAAIFSADQFAAEFLAVPRLLKLAALVLMYCQDSLFYRPGQKWTWVQLPDQVADRQKIEQWIAIVIQAFPRLGGTVAAFVKAADQLRADAAELGPLGLHYTLDEVQIRVTVCIDVGLFEGLQELQPFAYEIATHITELTNFL